MHKPVAQLLADLSSQEYEYWKLFHQAEAKRTAEQHKQGR